MSIKGSIDLAVDRALEANCTAFQLFTRNPRSWKYGPLGEDETRAFVEKRTRSGIKRVVVHMPYLPNLASPDGGVMGKSRASLADEVGRSGRLGVDYVVAHIGSHMGKGSMVGVRNVAEACNLALEAHPNATSLLVENTAGQKNAVGARFEELRMILDGVRQEGRMGVCLDTCHVYAAGFDISTPTGVGEMLDMFDRTVGLERLRVVHLNDSKGALGRNLDRHEHIGMGRIGEEGFRALLGHHAVSKLPLLMETPQDERRTDADELAYVRSLIAG